MERSPAARARRHVASRSPAIATTLVAAALAGELVVGTLAPSEALAQADEPAPTEAPAHPGAQDSEEPLETDSPDEPAPEPPAPDGGTPPSQAPPVETPSASTPADAAAPVRTGFALDAASDARRAPTADGVPQGPPRTGDQRDAAPATSRTGHGPGDHPASQVHAPGAPARHGRRSTPRQRSTRDATDRRRGTRPPVARGDAGASAGPASAEHTVVAGEHLWSIAAARVAEVTGRDATSLGAEEIASYWTRLCMVNAPRLRSGNLNLVYPGEVIELPPT